MQNPRPKRRWIAFIAAAGAVILICVLVWAAATSRNARPLASGKAASPKDPEAPPLAVMETRDLKGFVGAEACRSCHQTEFSGCARAPHNSTMHPFRESNTARYFNTKQEMKDRGLGMTYSFGQSGGNPVCRVARESDGASEEMTPAYVIGSGRLGHTFLFERDGRFMESRLSYYPSVHRWDWTPGQRGQTPNRAPMGNVMDANLSTACFFCHSTVVGRVNGHVVAEGTRLNVTCERCHGPGASHMDAERGGRGLGEIVRYRSPSAPRIMHLCGQCHREPGAIPENELETEAELPRFTGTAFGASRCYRMSGDKLTCITCHNPHQSVSHDQAAYNRVCLSCHTGSAGNNQKKCPVNAKSGCVSCHMPAESIGKPASVKFTNHWIHVYRKGGGKTAGMNRSSS